MFKLAAIAVSIATVAIASPAHGAGTIEVSSHGVVISSTMRHCVNEDGSGGPKPCTWNIGPSQDGNGRGLAYWISKADVAHYVWATSPIHGPWHYVSSSPKARCVTDGSTVKCPDGSH